MVLKEYCIRFYYDLPLFDSTAIDVVVNAFIISISLLVVALPEGLPMAVTLSLVHSMKKMKQENNLVKYIDSSETMGNVNELCSDKTGTLTTGEMILARVFLTGTDYNLENNNPISNLSSESKVKGLNELRGKLMDFIYFNVLKNVTRYKKDEKSNKYIVNGSMTDQGFMNFIEKFRMQEEIEKFEHYQQFRKDLIKVEFSSDEKFMAASVYSEKTKKYRILVKGAFDYFKSQGRFGSYLTNVNLNKSQGDIIDSFDLESTKMDTKGFELFDNYIKNASENCLRSIFFGYKDISKDEYEKITQKYSNESLLAFKEFLNKDIIICGMMSFYDPPRDSIQSSIKKCFEAGVNLRMITGDDIRTAISISYKIGILSDSQYREICLQKPMPKEFTNPTEEERKKHEKDMEEYLIYLDKLAANDKLFCLDGSTFNKLTGGLRPNPSFNKKEDISESNEPYELHDNTKFCRIVKNLKVIARCANDNKLLLVFGLKKNKNIVAVTGDGTNDAIALKNSDVGFAMGIRGTAVAKGAADIILLDDSFTSIITAIKYGRNVFDSIRKFVQFQLTTNIVAIFMVLLGGIILKDSPLNAIQMLWVNLIMDSFASLALATEPPSEGLLKRKPIDKSIGIVTDMMKINIVSQAILQIIILLIVIFFGDLIFGVPSDRELTHFTWNEDVGYHFTIFFNIFVFLQVFNSINSRKLLKSERNIFIGITNNPLYLFIQGGICLGQIIMVQLGGRALRTQPLTLKQHLICMAIGSISLFLGFIVKCLPFEIEGDGEKLKKSTTVKSKGRGSTINGPISMKSRKN
jgi:Ca2+ transporting ATPase